MTLDGGGLEFYVDADVDFDFHVDVDEFCSSRSLCAIYPCSFV